MDTVQLLTLIVLAVLVFLAVTLRRSITRNAAVASPIPPTIEVTDPAVARSMLVDHADVFSNRPLAPFPVDYDAGRRRPSHSINIVPHGPLWRALRCNLSAGVLHRSRLGVVAPLHRDAVEDLVAGLSAQGQGGGVLLRDAVHTALYTISVRMCFGDGVATRDDVRAMQDTLREFFDNIVEARGLAASRVARLLHWRQWQHFGGTFDRLIGLFLPLVAARQRRRSQCGYGGGGGDDGGTIRPYVDSLLDLRVPDDDVDGARRPLTDHEMASLVWEFAPRRRSPASSGSSPTSSPIQNSRTTYTGRSPTPTRAMARSPTSASATCRTCAPSSRRASGCTRRSRSSCATSARRTARWRATRLWWPTSGGTSIGTVRTRLIWIWEVIALSLSIKIDARVRIA